MKKVLILFLTFLIIIGCDDSPTNENIPKAIYGIVKDTLGNPIANADIVLLFDVINSNQDIPKGVKNLYPNPVNHYSVIKFTMDKTGNLNFKLYDPVENRNLSDNTEENIESGEHIFTISAVNPEIQTKVTRNGIYKLILTSNERTETYKYLSLTDDPTIVTATTKTDSQGEFEISYDYIQLNEAIYRTEKNGYELNIIGKIELANEIEIYALVNNRKVAYHKMLINKDNIENIIVQRLKTK